MALNEVTPGSYPVIGLQRNGGGDMTVQTDLFGASGNVLNMCQVNVGDILSVDKKGNCSFSRNSGDQSIPLCGSRGLCGRGCWFQKSAQLVK